MKRLLVGLVILCCLSVARAQCELGDQPITLTRWSDVIQSPGYDVGMYPNSQNCTWNIRVNSGSKVNITFMNFDLEPGRFINTDPATSEEVCNDYVKITEGSVVLFEGCGRPSINDIISNTSDVTINFVTDESGQPWGFSLIYTGIPSEEIEGDIVLETPGYPDYPPPDEVFTWRALPNPSGLVVIRGELDNGTLPWCEDTPIMIINERMEIYNQKLCLNDSVMFAGGAMTIIYNHTSDSLPWVGRLFIEYVPGISNCELWCVKNNTDPDKKCTQDRMDGRRYNCHCNEDFDGRNCEVHKSLLYPCYSSPCLNNGVCSEANHSYSCECEDGYTGSDCESEIDLCKDLECKNGGSCVNNNGKFECQCEDGYSGEFCEFDFNECASDPCRNNGECEDNVGSFSCKCAEGYKGATCEMVYDDCDWKPCQNGGVCMMKGEGFQCTCTPDYTGTLCTISIDDGHCLQHVDGETGSGITWHDTLAGVTDTRPCPPGILGNATRKCVHESSSGTGGRWTRPDLGECVSPRVMDISIKATSLMGKRQASREEIEDVTRELVNATSTHAHGSETDKMLYPGDLVFATGVVKVVSMVVATSEDAGDSVQSIAELFGEAVDNLVDLDTVSVWRNTKTIMVEEKVTSLLESTETLADNLVKQHSRRRRSIGKPNTSDDSFAVTGRNIEFKVGKIRPQHGSTHIPAFTGSLDSSSIQLPVSVADIAKQESGGDFSVYFAKFKSVATLLSMKEDRHNGSDPGRVGVVNSDVISGRVLGMTGSLFRDLEMPVVITFDMKNPYLRRNMSEYCVFMNMSARSEEERWSGEGCVLFDSNDTHVTCHCSHLTNFALLMDVYGTSEMLDDSNSQALSFISYIGGSLSILGCLAAIIVFEYFRLRNDRVRIHEQLAVCIIAVQAVFLIGFSRTQHTETPTWACKTVAILLHYFLTAMFCWMLVEGIHLYVALVKVFRRGSHIRKYVAIGWGIPLVIVGISVGVFYHSYGTGNVCWLNNEMLLVCFVPTVGLVVLINTVILVIVLRVMLRSLHSSAKVTTTKEEKSGLWMSLKAAAVLLPLLGLTWTLGFLAVDTPGSKVMGYIFTYLFTICNSFQGVVFFVFHCLLNADVHSAYERRYRKRKRLTTMTSNDLTTLRRKRSSSENEAYVVEPSTVKTTLDKRLTNITFVDTDNHYENFYDVLSHSTPTERYTGNENHLIWRRPEGDDYKEYMRSDDDEDDYECATVESLKRQGRWPK